MAARALSGMGFDMGKDETVKTPLVQQIEEEDLQSIVEKVRHREPLSPSRRLPEEDRFRLVDRHVPFHLYTAGIGLLPTSIHRAVHLTFAIVAVFLLYPGREGEDKTKIPWFDWVLAAVAGVGTGYIIFFFNEIARRGPRFNPTRSGWAYSPS